MDICDRTMAAMTMGSWEKSHEEMLNRVYPTDDPSFFDISSEELYRCIEEDWDAYPYDPTWSDCCPGEMSIQEVDPEPPAMILQDSDFADVSLQMINPIDPGHLNIMVNPRTGLKETDADFPKALYTHLFTPQQPPPSELLELSESLEPSESIKPYHPHQDHDYLKMDPEKDDDEVKQKIEDDPDVDVWGIVKFNEQVSAPIRPRQRLAELIRSLPPAYPEYRRAAKTEKRSSKRSADLKRREQARKISNAVHAVLNIKKPMSVRQYRNTKLKNSVETTPSQSDIEEWHSQPVRPTYSKITKKKTSKGRIDHSESERHRREVLRRNFHSLSELIPVDFLRGEKASSQISKQKILNGAKSYIMEVNKAKCSYKSLYGQICHTQERWQRRVTSKLSKFLKKQK